MVIGDQITHIASHAAAPLIVIIDDDNAVRESMRLLLEASGYTVRDHASAESFLAYGAGEASLLLVDHNMTGMTGADLLELLHAKHDPVPAVIITGRADRAVEERCRRIGVKLLRKPVAEDILLASIEEAHRACPSNHETPGTASD
ncbi:FixJ family two-component response regulator [Rhizomicrobium palustre]|uniref:FixJ family two-component response regulator n=1 Tax=Rhizomicrobium palustre TaxID=189966 RepID=A0A846N061_9PROT|nr:response regulator [Rhizomicrobium palustre]NIK88943.1 FixJ family two-component response regulator [Rhizomicrobium palustre]